MAKKATRKAPAKTAPSTPKPRKSRARTPVPAPNEAETDAALPASLGELHPDAANPRKISDAAKKALRASLTKFGDLSGITFNRATGELVAGHQRLEQLRDEYGGDLPIEHAADGSASVTLGGNRFAVRIVDWSRAKQRAANVAANHLKLQGAFTEDLSRYLLEVEAEATAELPGVFDELLLVDMMGDGLLADAAEEDAEEDAQKEARVAESFQVVVECQDEEQQREVYDRLAADGLTCKLLTI